jgi:hypothetical protein
MKTFFLFFVLIAFCTVSSSAQTPISITSSVLENLFAVGKSQIELSAGDTTYATMNVGTASTSLAQSWTIPSVTYVDTSNQVNIAPASTPAAGDFPLATHATGVTVNEPGSTVTYYSYFRIVSDSLVSLGTAVHVKSATLDTTTVRTGYALVSTLPISLGTIMTSVDTLPTGPSTSEIQTTTTSYDAYGNLTIPNGTFACLRATSMTVIKFVGGSPIPNDTVVSFTWYSGEGHQARVSPEFSNQTSGSIPVGSISFTEIVNTTVFVAEKPTGAVSTFSLAQNYPNPFNPSTNISYSVASRQFVSLQVYDVLGRKVATLVNEAKDAGTYSVRFDASNLPSGVYLYRLRSGTYSETKKLLLMK